MKASTKQKLAVAKACILAESLLDLAGVECVEDLQDDLLDEEFGGDMDAFMKWEADRFAECETKSKEIFSKVR